MSNNTHHTLQQVILLATGAPGSVQLRDDLLGLYHSTGDWTLIAQIVDEYMNSLIPLTPNGISGLVQAVANNGLGLNLSNTEAEQITQELMGQGIDSWSKLFTFVITELTGDLAAVLNNRAIAAEQFTDLLARFGKNHFEDTQALDAVRAWIQNINVSEESLTTALTQAEQLIQQFSGEGLLNPEPTPEQPAIPAPGQPVTRTETVDADGSDNASAANVSYDIKLGTYVYIIEGFGVGDVLNFPKGDLSPSVINDNFDDGLIELSYGLDGSVVTIQLTGIALNHDALLNSAADFNTVFGDGTLNPEPARTEIINTDGADNARAASVTYDIMLGTYAYSIDGFSAGDTLQFPEGDLLPSIVNDNFDDGLVELTYGLDGSVVSIQLTGIALNHDPFLNSAADFNTVFGAGTLV